MEPVKRSRTRSKSIALDKPPLDDTEEESKAVNLNGENVEEKPENDADVNSAPADEEESKPSEEEPSKDNEPEPEQEIPKESEDTVEQTELEVNEEVVDNSISKPTNNEKVNSKGGGRKRKASEMKSEDESIVEDKDKDSSATNSTINKEDDNKSSEKNLSDSDHSKNEKDDTASESDLTIPSKETLGKGKRARIPNKRYSDILLSPNHKSKSLENGSEKIESENELPDLPAAKVTATPIAVAPTPTVTKRQSTSSPSVQQPNKKQKLPVDITNPLFLKPLDFGWKRELVWRATNDSNNKRMGDIYYYTPTGKKLRSMREVSENLKNKELTLDNFTFFKEPLGVDDPSKEIIRDAKYKMGTTVPKKLVTKIKSQRITSPKVSSPKVASPKLPPAKKVASPKLTPKTNETADSGTPASSAKGKSGTKKLGNFKIKLPAKSKMDKAKNKPDPVLDDSTESDSSTPKPATGTKRQAGRWSTSGSGDQSAAAPVGDKRPCQPCSIRCEGVSGIVPTLQCRLCLCLYHHECVGLTHHLQLPYVCKNCEFAQDQQQPSTQAPPMTAPPPLTPFNALKSAQQQQSSTASTSSVPPKLQRIPPSSNTTPSETITEVPTPEMPRLIPRPPPPLLHGHSLAKMARMDFAEHRRSSCEGGGKSLVGSVTSWLPHNSKIVTDRNAEPSEVPRPQYLEFLGGRKFLVIPKHNFMSVSPTVAATAGSRDLEEGEENEEVVPEMETGTILKDATTGEGEIKVEPDSPSKPENSQTPEAMEVDGGTAGTVGEGKETGKEAAGGREEEEGKLSTENSTPVTEPPRAKKRILKPNNITANSEKHEDSKFMDNYLQHLSYGYNTLLYVFQYLKVQDLLRAGCVCTMWRDIAGHPILWRTVRMKNSQVHSFEGLANTLKKHGTIHLDLRKMLLPSGGDEIWPQFSKAIERVDTLRKIELCRCPASVVEQLAVTNPNLEVINAVTIKCESMSLDPLSSLRIIKELRLKSTGGLNLHSIDALKELKTLRNLSLTSIRDLNKMNLNVIAELTNLESLDLGECTDFPENFGTEILSKLVNLERLRLEKGQGNCYTFEILDAVKDMSNLEQLELVNFDIKAGFDKALGACTNIKKLLIIPTYISQSATTNHMVLGGVLRLQKTLSHFVWGVTLELLRVTELFVDQCEEPEKKEKKEKKPAGNGDSIPVLKPVPLITDKDSDIPAAHDPPQVEILPLPNLQKLLLQSLPTTRVKILKIPFHATWRQSITDSVN